MNLILLAALLIGGLEAEPLERRIVRAVQVGTATEADVAEMRRQTKAPEVDFAGHALARAGLAVLGRDEGFPEWPLERLLDRTLSLLAGNAHGNIFPLRPGLPEGFGGDDLAFLLVYALAVIDQVDPAISALAPRLESEDELVRGVALQALRNLGTARANALVESVNRAGRDRNLPENLLADLYYPFLSDLKARLDLIPPMQRTREQLLAAAAEACGEKPALATYFLGFLPDAPGPGPSPELARLRELVRAPCFHTRYFAVRSLALRSAETPEFWTSLLDDTEDGWQRQQIVRVAFARFGAAFGSRALTLLAREPAQYVQWELMHGYFETRGRARFRDLWDVWQPTTLVYRLYFREGEDPLADADRDELLRWLETGARPRHAWVRNHLFYRLADQVSGRDGRRYLRLFDTLPEKGQHWWILSGLSDPGALPLLRYWLTLPSEESQHAQLEDLVGRLEQGRGRRSGPGAGVACCEPTTACLLARVLAQAPLGALAEVRTEAEARAFLEAATDLAEVGEPSVSFADPLGRVAIVTRGDRKERWEHLYGCWHRVESPPLSRIGLN